MKQSPPPEPASVKKKETPFWRGPLMGAAFLMATSAIGPGFLNNTTLFTAELLGSFGFIILISLLLDIGAQFNIWRIVTVSGRPAQEIVNAVFPGLGNLLSLLIAFGGLAFNIGNIAGSGMGLEVLTGLDPAAGAIISCGTALFIFWRREAGRVMDWFVKILGFAMIGLTLYVMLASSPPYGDAIRQTFFPDRIHLGIIVALVGGTVGGYISFAGAHRLLDAGYTGPSSTKAVDKSAVTGIVLTTVMRYLLFLATLGVVVAGERLAPGNPAASVFKTAAGMTGYRFFGIVMWSAAITSVIGASYTSVTFLRSMHPAIRRNERFVTSAFILVSAAVFLVLRQPPGIVLVTAGAVNGIILPLALAMLLVAVYRGNHFQRLRIPWLFQIAGWLVVAVMSWMAATVIRDTVTSHFR